MIIDLQALRELESETHDVEECWESPDSAQTAERPNDNDGTADSNKYVRS